MAHGVDLATDPILSQYYNDSPSASNTLYFKILVNPGTGVNLKLVDGLGYVNVYRFYKTKPCCPTITSSKIGNGTISPTPGPFTINSQGKQFDITADPGYPKVVTLDGTSKGSPASYTVYMNDPALDYANRGMEGHEIIADFTRPQYHLTIACDPAKGTSNPASGDYIHYWGEEIPITCDGINGYTFDHWHGTWGGNEGDAYPPYTAQMYYDISIEAVFTYNPPTHQLILDARNYMGEQICPGFSIDDIYAGDCYVSQEVSQETHKVYGHYSEWFFCWAIYYWNGSSWDFYNSFNDPENLYVSADTPMTAYYAV
jgi:hypothetical protein